MAPTATASPKKPFDIQAASEAVGVRPETAVRLMQLARDPDATTEQLEEIIDADPSMAIRTLKLANSALYGMRSRISRIERAIIMLGRENVAKLAASTSVESAYKNVSIDAPGITPDTQWRFSASVAFATELIANECHGLTSVARRKLCAEAFVTGLIHDIGTIVQAKLSPKPFAAAVAASLKSGVPLINHERRLIGIDHADIGMRLAEHWALPADLIQGIGFHHDPLSADTEIRNLACVIHVTVQLVRKADVGSFDGDTDMVNLEPAMEHLHVDSRNTDKLVASIRERLSSIPI